MSDEATSTVYLGRFISTPNATTLAIRHGAVLVTGGVIQKTAWDVQIDSDAIKAFGLADDGSTPVVKLNSSSFFFPGFVDTHIHAPQYPNSGIFGKSTLLDWLTTYTFPLESSLAATSSKDDQANPLAKAHQVYTKIIDRTLSHGTTLASYFATIDVPATNLLASLALQKGQRALIGRVCMDHPETCPDYYRDESSELSLLNAVASIEHINTLDPTGQLIAPIITPRFAPSCQEETLVRLGQLAKATGVRVQTHISENVGELALVKELFPSHDSYTAVYDAAGVLTDKTILAHGIHLSDGEINIIKTRGSKISHCPASNSSLGSGMCPVRKLLDAGVDVSIGTDVSGGYSVSILDSVRQCCLVSRLLGYVNGGDKKWNIGVTEGLWLATVGGAVCTGFEGRLGGFEEGMFWDVQEVELGDLSGGKEGASESPVDIFGWESWEDRVEKWVWNGDDRNVRRVWVNGRLVHSKVGTEPSVTTT